MRRKELINLLNTYNVSIKRNKVLYEGKEYKRKEWFINHDIKDNGVKYLSFLYNTLVTTLFALIIPFIILAVVGIIGIIFSFIVINEMKYYCLYISIVLLIIDILILIKIIKKEKVVLAKDKGQIKNTHIKYKEYNSLLKKYKEELNQLYFTFMPIKTNNLIIRESNAGDIDDWYEIIGDSEVCKYLSNEPFTYKQTINYINKGIKLYKNKIVNRLSIQLKETDKVIGFIGISSQELTETQCEVVYALNKNYWYKGYMAEALEAFKKYLISTGKKTIIAGHVEENINSGKVMMKCGFVRNKKKDYDMLIHGQMKHIIDYVYEASDER